MSLFLAMNDRAEVYEFFTCFVYHQLYLQLQKMGSKLFRTNIFGQNLFVFLFLKIFYKYFVSQRVKHTDF